jgi:hypothetical protein
MTGYIQSLYIHYSPNISLFSHNICRGVKEGVFHYFISFTTTTITSTAVCFDTPYIHTYIVQASERVGGWVVG